MIENGYFDEDDEFYTEPGATPTGEQADGEMGDGTATTAKNGRSSGKEDSWESFRINIWGSVLAFFFWAFFLKIGERRIDGVELENKGEALRSERSAGRTSAPGVSSSNDKNKKPENKNRP